MKRIALFLFTTALLISCQKEDTKPYSYWSDLVNRKYTEINTLTQSVPCTDIEEFQIVNRNGYFLVHPSIQEQFDGLINELNSLQIEMSKAARREAVLNDVLWAPNPPLRKVCEDGKPKLIFARHLTLEEINQELPARYEEIKTFYDEVACTDPSAWSSYFLRTGCCMEGVAIHKTVRTAEMYELVHIHNRLWEAKLTLEKTSCTQKCNNLAKPLQCVNGRPVIEMAAAD